MVTPASSDLEKKLWRSGFMRVGGVDEAGRGALAGPLVAAAVILPPLAEVHGLRDSKKLTPARREVLFDEITSLALATNIVVVDNVRVDELGVHHANLAALHQAAAGLSERTDYLLSDGYAVPDADCPSLAVPKGDAVSISVAAASVLAKVARDRIMCRLDEMHPEYMFAKHKGYGTAEHLAAIRKHGPCPVHRRSFAPVAGWSV